MLNQFLDGNELFNRGLHSIFAVMMLLRDRNGSLTKFTNHKYYGKAQSPAGRGRKREKQLPVLHILNFNYILFFANFEKNSVIYSSQMT